MPGIWKQMSSVFRTPFCCDLFQETFLDTPDWYWRPRPVHPGALGLPVFIVISQVQIVSSSIFRSRCAVLNHRLYVLFVFNLPALPWGLVERWVSGLVNFIHR